jgi:hypothetical protein
MMPSRMIRTRGQGVKTKVIEIKTHGNLRELTNQNNNNDT